MLIAARPSTPCVRPKAFPFVSHIECNVHRTLPHSPGPCSATVFLELPVAVVERADLAGLEPAGDAVEVEGVLYHG